ncbi:MAG: ribosomal protein S18-alanine N-acetyltransferase [Bacteroides sp.]
MSRIIRKMREEDLDEVEAIEKASFSIPWSRNSIKDAMNTPDNVYIVCEEDGHIAGYCGMWTVLGEGNIVNVAVGEAYRRRGIGREMMDSLIERGLEKQVDIFFLEVRQSNEAAKHLYESAGFKNIGLRKNFYEKPCEDACVMSRIISK